MMGDTEHDDLFVSYAAADHGWVGGFLLPALAAAGLRARAVAVAADATARRAALTAGIAASSQTLLVLSPAYLADAGADAGDLLAARYGRDPGAWPARGLIHRATGLPEGLIGLRTVDATDPLTESSVLQQLATELRGEIAPAAPLAPAMPALPLSPQAATPSGAGAAPQPAGSTGLLDTAVPVARAVAPPPPAALAPPAVPPLAPTTTPAPAPRRPTPPAPTADADDEWDLPAVPAPGDLLPPAPGWTVPPPRPAARQVRWSPAAVGVLVGLVLVLMIPILAGRGQSRRIAAPTFTPTVNPAIATAQDALRVSARGLAVAALGHLNDDPALGLLLSVEAYRIADTVEVRDSLLRGLQAHAALSRPFAHYPRPLTRVAVSNRGDLLAAATADQTLVVWDVARQTPIAPPLTGYRAPIVVVQFVAGSWLTTLSENDKILGWDLDQRPPATFMAQDIHGKLYIPNPARSADDRLEAATATDGLTVTVRERYGPVRGTLAAREQGQVTDVAFSPDSGMLATAGADGSLVLWDTATLRPLGLPLDAHPGGALGVAFAPDGRLVSVGQDGAILWWETQPAAWIAAACRAAGRNLTPAEWQTYLPPTATYHPTCPDVGTGMGTATPIATP